MKRFLVFAWDHYYPSGGWNDFKIDIDNLDDAKLYARDQIREMGRQFAQVVDTETGNTWDYYQ
jgi:hypothetical protein